MIPCNPRTVEVDFKKRGVGAIFVALVRSRKRGRIRRVWLQSFEVIRRISPCMYEESYRVHRLRDLAQSKLRLSCMNTYTADDATCIYAIIGEQLD